MSDATDLINEMSEALQAWDDSVLPVVRYTTTELAHRLSVDTSTVRKWVLGGKLQPAWTTHGGHHRFSQLQVDLLLAQTSAADTALTA